MVPCNLIHVKVCESLGGRNTPGLGYIGEGLSVEWVRRENLRLEAGLHSGSGHWICMHATRVLYLCWDLLWRRFGVSLGCLLVVDNCLTQRSMNKPFVHGSKAVTSNELICMHIWHFAHQLPVFHALIGSELKGERAIL